MKRILEKGIKNFEYNPPKDPELLLYDFYFLIGYLPQKHEDPELRFTFTEALDICTKNLQKHMLRALKWALSAEFRHSLNSHMDKGDIAYQIKTAKPAKDIPEDDLPTSLTKGAADFYLAYEKAYYLNVSGTVSATVNGSEKLDAIAQRRSVKSLQRGSAHLSGRNATYGGSYLAVNEAQKELKLSDVQVGSYMAEIFNKGSWDSSFGGKAWGRIAEGYVKLLKADTTQGRIIYIDHAYDLQHNTGTVFTKVKTYYKGGGYDWIKRALDWKKDNSDIREFYTRVSPSLRYVVAWVGKNSYGVTLEDISIERDKAQKVSKKFESDALPKVAIKVDGKNRLDLILEELGDKGYVWISGTPAKKFFPPAIADGPIYLIISGTNLSYTTESEKASATAKIIFSTISDYQEWYEKQSSTASKEREVIGVKILDAQEQVDVLKGLHRLGYVHVSGQSLQTMDINQSYPYFIVANNDIKKVFFTSSVGDDWNVAKTIPIFIDKIEHASKGVSDTVEEAAIEITDDSEKTYIDKQLSRLGYLHIGGSKPKDTPSHFDYPYYIVANPQIKKYSIFKGDPGAIIAKTFPEFLSWISPKKRNERAAKDSRASDKTNGYVIYVPTKTTQAYLTKLLLRYGYEEWISGHSLKQYTPETPAYYFIRKNKKVSWSPNLIEEDKYLMVSLTQLEKEIKWMSTSNSPKEEVKKEFHFEKGKWYRFRQDKSVNEFKKTMFYQKWNGSGMMDFMLDGKARQVVRVSRTAPVLAEFAPLPEERIKLPLPSFYWWGAGEYFEEVPGGTN